MTEERNELEDVRRLMGISTRAAAAVLGVSQTLYRRWARRPEACPEEAPECLRANRPFARRKFEDTARARKVGLVLSPEALEVWHSWPRGQRSDLASAAIIALAARTREAQP